MTEQRRLETQNDFEWRAAGDGSDHINVRGHAAVFDRLSENLGGFREIIDRSAFDEVLTQSPDVRLLFNHDPSKLLARTSAGTLTLSIDDTGLHSYGRVPTDLSYARDVETLVRTGLVNQMSFAFDIGVEERDGEVDGVPVFRVKRASALYDVSLVTFPAYVQTDASLARMRMVSKDSPLARQGGGEQEGDTSPKAAVATQHVDLGRQRELQKLRAKARLCVVQFSPIG